MINESAWDRLMDKARRESRANMERRRVVGVRGVRGWIYIAQCGSECRACVGRVKRAREGIGS